MRIKGAVWAMILLVGAALEVGAPMELSAAPTVNIAQTRQQPPQQQPKAQKFQGQVVKMQANNAYGLQTSSGTFLLDNQAESQQFAGKVVVVTGTLDPNGVVIHVATIQMAG